MLIQTLVRYVRGAVLSSALCFPIMLTAAPNLIVTTDIGGDPDDMQAMRRLMLYSNEFNILGLVASASGTPGEVGQAVTRPDLIADIVDDYATVRTNLALHASGYPTASYLHGVVKSGNPNRGTSHVGEGHDTAGSNWIVSQVDAASGPVNIAVWGGATDVAQAFHRVRTDRTDAQEATWVAKVRIYTIAEQDGANTTCAWLRNNFPNIWMVEAGPANGSGYDASFRGMYQNDSLRYNETPIQLVETANVPLNQEAWLNTNVRSAHGVLGANYPVVTQNPPSSRNTSGVKEGDSPSWLYFLENGLSDSAQPGWGSWGGRFQTVTGQYRTDTNALDAHWSGNSNSALRRKWTVARWRKAVQNEFAARMDWCVKPVSQANHAPVAVLNGDSSRSVLSVQAATGSAVALNAAGSSDPDGNTLSYRWWIYKEAGSYTGTIAISNNTNASASLTMPADSAGTTVHVILEVTDSGSPALTSFRRLVITGTSANSSGLAAHWKLDETTGTTAADSSGNNLSGTLTNGPVWSAGLFGNALSFDGSNDFVNVGNPTALRLTGAMTLSAWIKADTFTNSGRIVAKQGSASARGWSLNVESSGVASFQIASNASTNILVNSPAIQTGQWYLLTGVYEPGASLKIYVNGALAATNTVNIPASQYNNSLNVNIGRRPDQGLYFDGLIDDVRVYNRALSAAEVASLNNQFQVNDAANAADWSFQSNLQISNRQYGDRTYVFTSIPTSLLGCNWIRTANDSKTYTGATLVSFSVTADTHVYVAHNNAIPAKPAWLLSGWADTGMDITNSENTPASFRLYLQTFPAGSVVSLGANGATVPSLYSVFLLPAAP